MNSFVHTTQINKHHKNFPSKVTQHFLVANTVCDLINLAQISVQNWPYIMPYTKTAKLYFRTAQQC